MRYKFFFLGFFLIYNCACAVSTDTAGVIIEQGWIERMNHSIGIKISFDNRYETFRVDAPGSDIRLYPNITSTLNAGLYYRFLRLSIGFSPDFLPGNSDETLKGKTTSISIDLAAYIRHWSQQFSFSKVSGYYLQNTADFLPGWAPGDAYIQFPDLHYFGIGGKTGYYLNPRLSLKSLSIQTERQLRSAGSFIAAFSYNYYVIDDQSVPGPGGATQKSSNMELSIGPGYIYNYVINNRFYAALAAQPGVAMINTRLLTRFASENIKTNQQNWGFRWEATGALGYNGEKYYSGIYITASGLTYKQENTTAMNADTRIFYQFFVGKRIRAPRKLNQFFDDLNVRLKKK